MRIENYRSIKILELDFDDEITVLVGENGCGKTSVLNALEACLGRRVAEEGFRIGVGDFHRDILEGPQSTDLSIVIEFLEFSRDKYLPRPVLRQPALRDEFGLINFRLHVEANRDELTNDITKSFHFENKEGQDLTVPNPDEVLSEILRVCPLVRIRSAALRPATLPTDSEPTAHKSPREQVEYVVRQVYTELLEDPEHEAEKYIKEHQSEIETVLNDLDTRMINPPVHDVEDRLAAPLSTTGSWQRFAGLLRGSGARSLAMLSFAGALLSQGGGKQDSDTFPIISIEDPEAYLHPLMLTSVWNFIDRLPAQRVVTTNHADLLSAIPLTGMRRMLRTRTGVGEVFQVPRNAINVNDMRRISYHLRIRRGSSLFMRFWLLVEGETEYWVLPEVARAMGYDLWEEGVELVEFAQCGLDPIATLANYLGIPWHLMADGDKAGKLYCKKARPLAYAQSLGKVTQLPETDIEHCFWDNGYEDVFREQAGTLGPKGKHIKEKTKDIIKRALKRNSKPGMAIALGHAMAQKNSPGVPKTIRDIIDDAVDRARHGRGQIKTAKTAFKETK